MTKDGRVKTFEIGPGKVLAGTVKRTVPESKVSRSGCLRKSRMLWRL